VTSFTAFFTGTATVAGALVGLLFVALSVSPAQLRGAHASLEHQAIASTAFTALTDALFISLIALQPGAGLAYGGVILGGIGLTSSLGLAVRLWRARATQGLSRRWPYLLGFIIVTYAAQVITALVIRAEGAEANLTAAFVYIMFATGIARSWELIGLQGGGPLDLLARRLGAQDPLTLPGAEDPAAGGPPPVPRAPGPDSRAD
jgi:hypothetical protein